MSPIERTNSGQEGGVHPDILIHDTLFTIEHLEKTDLKLLEVEGQNDISPEERLWITVIQQAIFDACQPEDGSTPVSEMERHDARCWLLGVRNERISDDIDESEDYSLKDICTLLDVNFEAIYNYAVQVMDDYDAGKTVRMAVLGKKSTEPPRMRNLRNRKYKSEN